MAAFWCQETEAFLIEKIRSTPVLWDPKHPLYPKKLLKKYKYEEIAAEMAMTYPSMAGINADTVLNKFSILKASFRRELAKMKYKKSGSGIDQDSKWKHFEELSFLLDGVVPGSSTSNLENISLPESLLSVTCLVPKDPYASDEEVIHARSESPSQGTDHERRPASESVPLRSGSSSGGNGSTSQNDERPSATSTPAPKRRRTNESKDASYAVDEALAILKSAVNLPRVEDIPYAAGIIVREAFREFPQHRHIPLLLKLTTFVAKLKEEEENKV